MAVKASATVTIADISDGTDGTGIKSTKIEYKAGSSGTTAPTGTWLASVPATSASAPYLWTRVTYTYTDGSPDKVVYSVGSTPEGISVGGRNLIRNTSDEWKSVTCDQYRARIPELLGDISISDYGLRVGDTVTLGFYVKTTSGKKLRARIEFFKSDSDRNSAYGGDYIQNGEGYVYVTTVLKDGYDTIGLWVDANLTMSSNTDTTTEYVKCVMFEKSNRPSNWTPAPEDIYSKIETESSQKANEAAKTATNYMKLDETAGLVIGNLTGSTLGKNVKIKNNGVNICDGDTVLSSYGASQTIIGPSSGRNVLIDSDSVDIRDGSTVLATFADDYIYLGKNKTSTIIDLCSGSGKISRYSDGGLLISSDTQVRLQVDNSGSVWLVVKHDENTSGTSLWMTNDGYNTKLRKKNNVIGQISMQEGISSMAVGLITGEPQAYIDVMNTDYDTTNSIKLRGLNDINILGSDLVFRSTKAGTSTYRPYYRKGDVIQFSGHTAGYVSNSATRVYFTIPISKPIIGSPTLSGSSVNGFKIRQSGSYTHGSTSDSYVIPSSYTLALIGDGAAIRAYATFSDTTNAKNNYPCGIQVSMNITMS